jgi:hypothetical protein
MPIETAIGSTPATTGPIPGLDALSLLGKNAGKAVYDFVSAAGANVVGATDASALAGIIKGHADAVLDSQKALAAANDIVLNMLRKGVNNVGESDHAAIIQKHIDDARHAGTGMSAGSTRMSKLTKEQRDKMDKADFGDPERRLFPIQDQGDVDDAARLVGKAKSPDSVRTRIMHICERKKLKAPESWTADHSRFSVEFALDSSQVRDDGDHVLVPAPILFRLGDYPDKGFSLSPEEAEFSTLQNFPGGGVELDLEHKPTVLSGKLGTLHKVFSRETDSWILGGECRIPKWLHAILGPEDRKLSVAFDRKTKHIIGCGLVRNPRVTDAAMMAAFAQAEAGRQAATVTPTAPTTIVPVAPVATSQPAQGTPIYPVDASGRPIGGGPTVSPAGTTVAPVTIPVAPTPAPAPAPTPAFTETDRLRLELEREKAAGLAEFTAHVATAAAACIDNEILAGCRVLPRERDALIAQYKQAAVDDRNNPTKVEFNGEPVTRVEALKRSLLQREPHNLSREQLLVQPGAQTLFNAAVTPAPSGTPGAPDRPMSPERRKQLLNMTQLGRHTAAQEANRN